MSGPKAKPLLDRFMSHVRKDALTGCWIWTASRNWAGYGRIVIGSRTTGRKSVSAHRLSYELFNGKLYPGMDVCHTCDTPACVNPNHLFLGTRSENMQDMVSKGRARKPDSTKAECRNGHALSGVGPCAECSRQSSRRHYERNRQSERERKKASYWENPELHRERKLASYHGRK